jgi:hypothetical protein
VRSSGTSRNNTDDFFILFLMESMRDQQNRTRPYGPNCDPSLFIFKSEVALRKSVGIIENENRRFKANIVLAKVLPVLAFVPFKLQGLPLQTQDRLPQQACQYICTYTRKVRCVAAAFGRFLPIFVPKLRDSNFDFRPSLPGGRPTRASWRPE